VTCPFTIDISPHTLRFIKPAGTSRGIMTTHKVWYVCLTSTTLPYKQGWGECAPLPGLSVDDRPDYESLLLSLSQRFEAEGRIDWAALKPYPSLYFGFESAWLQYERGDQLYFETDFSMGKTGIPINGLVWMGSLESMTSQVENLLSRGFSCIKFKIGALRFEDEWTLIRSIRKRFPVSALQIRVDANGAFTPEQAMARLHRLAELDIHSIEQPIKAGQWPAMARLTATSPLPIALDEELIGVHDQKSREALLDTIKPAYLVLKPSLHGGIEGCRSWIQLAEARQTGWWVTSALESNVGLTTIAQWCATLNNPLHQGLGTGSLYENNTCTALHIKGERLYHRPLQLAIPGSQKEKGQPEGGFLLNGQHFNWESLQAAYPSQHWPKSAHMDALMAFLSEWFDPSPTLTIQTSGSTGVPTSFKVPKSRLIYSARQTIQWFNLKEGDDCLLCLDLQFIAAKMMVIRALVGGLSLWIQAADGHPFKQTQQSFRFVPLVPMQVYNSLQHPAEKEALERCSTLLIGGAALSPELEQALQTVNTNVYASYGMAETLSHIALRKINGKEASTWFTPLPGIHLSLTDTDCLRVEAPMLCVAPIETKDIAMLDEMGRFRILGRQDNLINTGGKKILAERLEATLSSYIKQPFAISKRPDTLLGERLVLVTEGPFNLTRLLGLEPAWTRPRELLVVDALPLTSSGKIDRATLEQWVNAQTPV